MIDTQILVTIIISLLGSSAAFGFIQFLITRKDNREARFQEFEDRLNEIAESLKEEIASIHSKIHVLHGDIDKSEAINARIRILSASDELRHGQAHSKEFFDQLNDDITLYENYCREHVDFKNNRSVHAIDNINRAYSEALKRNNFL